MSLYRPAVAGFLGLAMVAAAQEAELSFTRSVTEGGQLNSVETRPNVKQPFFMVVKNRNQQETTFTVELEIPVAEPKGAKPIKLSKQVTLKADEAKAVSFEPPPPPKKIEPPKTPAEAKKEAEEALKPEPPAGIPVPVTTFEGKRAFVFKVRVLNNKKSALSTEERDVRITIQHPSRYLNEPDVTLQGAGARRDLVAIVGAPARKTEATPREMERDFEPSVDVRFEFPPQLGLKVANLPAGSYRRPISKTGQQVTLRAENLPIAGTPDVPVKYHFTVDGYPRAFNYSSNVRRAIDVLDTAANKEKRVTASAVRLYPIGTSTKVKVLEALVTSGATTDVPRFATLPSKELRFRVETDNEADNSNLVLRIARAGAMVRPTVDLDPDEIIDLGLPKEQRVWLDVAGAGDSLIVANTTGDHVASVDVSALRGLHELQAVLREPDPLNPAVPKETKTSYYVVVDETPPPVDDIRIAPFPKRLERGKPLPVFVTASDPETFIDKVVVVVGKPGPDGKFPPEAVVVDAIETALGWVAQVPLPVPPPAPPPPPGAPPVKKEPVPPIDITVVATNEVGLSTARVVRIELVEPLGATIELTVLRGGRPQPDTPVTLVDADGKEKGAGKTDKKGLIVFTNMPPGVYKATALKEDASYGLAGYVAMQVPDPPPPPTKPIPVTMDLRKRR